MVETLFDDPITIVLDAEIEPLGGSTLGQTVVQSFAFIYDDVRSLMINDADSSVETIVASIPTFANAIWAKQDTSFIVADAVRLSRANGLALGISASSMSSGAPSAYDPLVKRDALIKFNSNFAFDFDASDGIAANQVDFTAVAVHEIAHAMGFTSEVDLVANVAGQTGNKTIAPNPLDLFRLRPGDGSANFSAKARLLCTGSIVANQVTYDGGIFSPTGMGVPNALGGDIPMSTGLGALGDGNQASH